MYIIFTSGSTGNPKGVTISHENLLNLMFFEKEKTNILNNKTNKILQFATLSFDVSYQEIFSALLFGNTLVLIDDVTRKDMHKLADYIVNKRIDTLFIPPAYLKLLVEESEIVDKLCTNVKNIITAGEALVITNGMRTLLDNGIQIHNHYGPAETHVATTYTVDKDNVSLTPPIGKPISNANIHILDNNHNLCPIGIIGEIAISGNCVGNGYINNDDLTSKKFLINKYNNKKMYLTGDLGFYDYNGIVHYIGRSDFQVKINGFRIELGEIDHCLNELPEISSSISIIHEENEKKYIITYYIAKSKIDEKSILKHIKNTLPFYMMPKKLIKLDYLPINANGKIDRKKLPKVNLTDTQDTYILPSTKNEIAIVEICEQLFNIDKIGINSNFFDIGGDSLLAIKLSSLINAKLNVDVKVGEIYDNPSIADLAQLIDNKKTSEYEKITKCLKKDLYNVSSAQKRIYNATKIDGENSILYNMPGVIIFDNKPDVEKLNKCFNKLIERHSSLRTSFEVHDLKIYQRVVENLSFNIETSTLKNIDINKVLNSFVKPFNLEKAPLLRANLVFTESNKSLLLFDMHHIISDGFSLNILTKELSSFYNNETLTALPIEYIDYAEWEFKHLSENKLEKSKNYWINQFKKDIPLLNMPTDYSRPAIQSYKGAKVHSIIKKDLFDKINLLSNKLGVSSNMIFLACYFILLSKYTNQEDIIVGSPIAGRTRKEILDVIGVFINTLPLKNHVDDDITFIDFLKNVKKTSLLAIEHQEYPFDELIYNLSLDRDTSRNPLFDTMFIYQNDGYPEFNFSGLNSELYIPDSDISKFDLTLEVVPSKQNYKLNFEYSTSLFAKDTIDKIAEHFINIVTEITNQPEIKISDINMLSLSETTKILYDFNNTKKEYQDNKSFIDLFNEQVKHFPNRTAIVFHNKKITYKELNKKANQIASYLINQGIKNNDFVGLLSNRSIELVAAIIGILKAGAAYVPIDPSYPIARINYMIEDSNVKIVLSQKDIIKDLNIKKALEIDFHNSSIYKKSSTNEPNLTILPNNYAYLIYTSGSTGKPKGVIINHKNINNFITGMCDRIDFSKIHNVLSITTVSFDIFGLEILLPLQKGLTIILADEEEQTNQQKLNSLCKKNNVDIIQTTPSKFELLIEDPNELDYIIHMNYILLGGEQFPLKLLRKIKSITKAKIYNVYGPTETTIWSSVKDLSESDSITIGTPISNTYMYILDKNMNLLPPGIPGNLFIGGDGVSIGYHNNSNLTNQKFVKIPSINNNRIYNTGDLAKWLPSGEIECLGRDDFQVKLHGLRIELGEIEASILNYPSISNCVVCVKNLKLERQVLCAYVISKEKIDTNSLKEYLSNILPSYMIPTYIEQIEKLSYTPNGKINRNALPMPNALSTINDKNHISPQTDTEIELSKMLEDILDVSNISISDNLFNLGIDSLSAIILCTKIRQKFNIDITFKDIVNNSSLRLLSNKIDNTKNLINIPTIPRCKTMEYYPTSSAQRRIYLASNMDNEKNSTLYNISGGLLFEQPIDAHELQRIFDTILKRHEILRTYFEVIDGNIVQKIVPHMSTKIDIIESKNSNIDDLLKNHLYTFDLNKAPLFKLTLFKLPNNKEFLMLDVHHIVFDGTSLRNLLQEFNALYRNESLPELAISYKDFAVWEQEQILNNSFEKSKEYWNKQFDSLDIPVLDMPASYSRPAKKSYEGNTYVTSLSEDITKKVNSLSSHYNCTPYMIMLCAYYILLYKYTNQEDIIVGSPVSGRLYSELQPLFGVFVNSLPLKNNITPDITFSNLLQNTKNICIDAFAHQDYPLDALVNDLNISRDSSRNPLFDTMFAYQNIDNIDINLNGSNSKIIIAKSNTSKFDITLEVTPKDGLLILSYEYSVKIFSERFIKDFAKHYENILIHLLENPKIKVSNISILSNEEKNKLLFEFNNKRLNYNKEQSIIEVFDEQVKNHSNNIAISIDDKQMTYKELNEKANALALQLRKKSIQSGDVVGVLLSRSLELVVSILAILKCNAIYMPLYSGYPDDRINYMIKNSKSKLIITNKDFKDKLNHVDYYIFDNIKDIDYAKTFNNKFNHYNDTAYIIYTSGSTGRPKGVQITNKNLNNFINSFNKYFKNISTKDKFLSSTNISFDVSIFEIFMPLLNGATLVLYHDELIKDIIDYCNYIIENKITALYIPPNILNEVYYILRNKENVKIDKLLVGVEAIKKTTLNKYFSINPNMCIINGYGPSETTICCTALHYKQDNSSEEEIVSIGKPLYNNNIYILGNDNQLQPVGVIGELCVTGDGLGPGYINNIEETSKSFIDNVYDNLSEKMYKTGDLGKWNVDGTISLIGRKDRQVKISGYRIELKEIDNVIMKYPEVEKSISIVLDYEEKKRIYSYFIASKAIPNIDILSYLSKKLPFYMIPSSITQLKSFPVTSNGKIDTNQLPKPVLYNNVTEKTNYVAPSNKLESQVADIFESLLSISPIGIDDNFFKLGGDSLLAINLQIELLKKNINITYSDIFMNPTVRELCYKITSHITNTTKVSSNTNLASLNNVLKNTCNMPNNIKQKAIGNILLTGVTGFLGSHVLDAFLTHENGIVYCLMRSSKGMTLQEKLQKRLNYYFGNKYDNYIGTRIILIESDITKNNLGISPQDINALASDVSCIINCAAKVTHYGDYNVYKEINVNATENLLKFALKNNKKFYQVSTLSVSGISLEQPSHIDQEFENNVYYKENNFFINQSLDNVYVRSKFEAEKLVLQYISNGADAYILRVGNLMNRYSDGKFQPNVEQNAYIGRLMSLANIGYIPDYLLKNYLEFTPIDSCALAVIKLMQNPNSENRVFHLYNHNHVEVDKFISFIKDYIDVKIVSNEKFINKVDELLEKDNSNKILSGILRDFDNNRYLVYDSKIKITSYFTINYLLKLGFIWPKIDKKYLKQFLDYYRNLGLLKKKGE